MNEPVLAELVDQCDVVFHLAAAVGVKLIVEAAGPHDRDQRARHRGRAQARQQEEEARADRLDVRGVRQEHGGAVPRGRPTSCWARRSKHRWAYACSKAIDEFLALAYWKEKKLPVIIVRLLQHGRAAPDRPVRDGRSRTSCGRRWPGSRSRCSATARRRAASPTSATSWTRSSRARRSEPRAVGQVFNIGNGDEISIRDLAERVKALTGSPSADRHDPVRPGVRGRVRGHAAARARHLRRIHGADRLRAARSQLDEILERVDRLLAGRGRALARPLHAQRCAHDGAEAAAAHAARSRSAGCLLAAGRDRAPRLPEIVQIESTNICNAKCVVLPARRHEAPAGHHGRWRCSGRSSTSARRSASGHVRMHNYGEPFVDRQLVEKVALRQAARHRRGRHDQQRVADRPRRWRAA